MKNILSLSYGKDSIASIEAIKCLGWQLDEIITVDVMATPTISANFPEVEEFKKHADNEIFKRYGLKVKHVKGRSFEEWFYQKKVRGKNKGEIYGFPISASKGGWCMRNLKIIPYENYLKDVPDKITYLGIAADEIKRGRNKNGYKYPLIEMGWTEQDCYKWCKENNLLSPTYEHSFRDGCWFCPKQRVSELRRLRNHYPEYWEIMMKWDKDSSTTWGTDGKRLKDYEKRFQMEEGGLVPYDKTFRWKMLEQDHHQLKMKL